MPAHPTIYAGKGCYWFGSGIEPRQTTRERSSFRTRHLPIVRLTASFSLAGWRLHNGLHSSFESAALSRLEGTKTMSLHAPTTNTLAHTVTRLSPKAIASTSLTCDRRAILAALRECRRRPKTALVVGPAPDSALRGFSLSRLFRRPRSHR